MIAQGRDRLPNNTEGYINVAPQEEFNVQAWLPQVWFYIGTAAIFTFAMLLCGWMAFQATAGQLNIGPLSPGRESLAWLGALYMLFMGPFVYAWWQWFQTGNFRDSLFSGARFLPLTIMAVIISILPEQANRTWLLTGWFNYLLALLGVGALIWVAQLLLKQAIKSRLEDLQRQVDRTVVSIEGALSNLTNDAQRTVEDLRSGAKAARGAFERAERVYSFPFKGVPGVIAMMFIFASGISIYAQNVVPRLPKAMGGMAPTPMVVRLKDPKEIIEGRFLAADDKVLVIAPTKVNDKPAKQGSIYRIPWDRSEIVRTDR